MDRGEKCNISINGKIIEEVEETVYLGQVISFKKKEISGRIKSGWKNFWYLRTIYGRKINLKLKNKILGMATLPALMYGAQIWAITKTQTTRLQKTQREMGRRMRGIRKVDKITKCEIKRRTEGRDVDEIIKNLKWKYAGHIIRQEKDHWGRKLLNWRPYEGQRRRRRTPYTRIKDEITKREGNLRHRKVWDRKKWEASGETYAQTWAITVRPF